MPYYHTFETMQSVNEKLAEFAVSTFWAKSSVIITSTLSSFSVDATGKIHPNKYRDYKITLRKAKKNSLLKLSIISWYLDEVVGFPLREEIRRTIRDRIEFWEVNECLLSKGHAVNYLADHFFHLSTQQIFGNYLDKNQWSNEVFSRLVKVTRVKTEFTGVERLKGIPEKRTIAVGYNDKGTLPKSWKPRNSDFDGYPEQVQIEKARQMRSDHLNLLGGTLR